MTNNTPGLRNINPHWYSNGMITSEAFSPTEAHDYRLSMDNGDSTTAKASFDLFRSRGLNSVGIATVTIGDFEPFGIPVVPDPIEVPPPPNPHHITANYFAQDKKTRRAAAKLLSLKAAFEKMT